MKNKSSLLKLITICILIAIGFILINDVIQDIKDFDGYKAYLAGPPKMVEVAEEILTSKGIRKVDIHSDAFYTPYDEIKE